MRVSSNGKIKRDNPASMKPTKYGRGGVIPPEHYVLKPLVK